MAQVTIELENHLAEKLNKLVSFFGDKETLFASFIEYHKKKAEREISRMQQDLDKFEEKYKMSSPIFFEQFESGKLNDSHDFILWSGIYEMQLARKQKLQELI
ncbi:MAG: hypothetical protein SF052_20395 [Bacteroidia bacterium]|nr:hypothetical protein [Bacteroidia bacterium]